MSPQEFTLPDLPGIANELFSDHNIVAITPEGGDPAWAAGVAWSVARAAAATGRKTALIDLNLESPSLHEQAKEPKETGIVDAFSFGASLQHVASREDDPDLYFIGVGTPPLDPEEVWGSDRWQRLSRGFEKEGAILLLFLLPSTLEQLFVAPDLILALSPAGGFGAGGPKYPQLRSAIDRGVPFAMVTDTPLTPAESHDPDAAAGSYPSERPEDASRFRSGMSRKALLAIFGVVAIAAVVLLAVMLIGKNSDEPIRETPPDTTTRVAATQADSQAEPLAVQDAAIDSSADSVQVEASSQPDAIALPYSIQVAAWTRLNQAQDHVAQFSQAGIPATISVVPRDSARVWYRVFVGAAPNFNAAADLRQRLREQGLIASTSGVPLETPYALLLGRHGDARSGREAMTGLRESGIPAYIVSMPDGSVQVLLGAFESPDQAEMSDSVFAEAGSDLSRTIVSRVGITR